MNIIEAIEKTRKGKLIRRHIWDNYLPAGGGLKRQNHMFYQYCKPNYKYFNNAVYHFSDDDLLSEDWYTL